MTRAQRDALAALAQPEDESEVLARIRGRLDAAGLLGIVAESAMRFDVEVNDVLSMSRREPVVAARHAAWTRIYQGRRWSYERIARLFEVTRDRVRTGVRGQAPEVQHARAA